MLTAFSIINQQSANKRARLLQRIQSLYFSGVQLGKECQDLSSIKAAHPSWSWPPSIRLFNQATSRETFHGPLCILSLKTPGGPPPFTLVLLWKYTTVRHLDGSVRYFFLLLYFVPFIIEIQKGIIMTGKKLRKSPLPCKKKNLQLVSSCVANMKTNKKARVYSPFFLFLQEHYFETPNISQLVFFLFARRQSHKDI